jgi:hypothetical protein
VQIELNNKSANPLENAITLKIADQSNDHDEAAATAAASKRQLEARKRNP